jgi:hypothetical protein
VAYVDNDAVVLSHLRALAAKGDPAVTVVDGDVHEPAAILHLPPRDGQVIPGVARVG